MNKVVISILLFVFALWFTMKSKNNSSIVIGLAGDTMLGRMVDKKINQTSYEYPWGDLLPLLQQTDLNLINLETTLTRSKKKVPKLFNYKATPGKVKTLQAARIDVVNLANNHIRDFNDEGLLETVATLDATGIKHVGAGKNISAAKQPVIITKKGIKVGIIGYTDNEPSWLATEDKPGANYFSIGDIETVKNDIKNLRNQVDLLILSIHWGPNMRERPTQEFINFAHEIIDAGVDIIHGHSAHIFQGIEIYNGKLVLYDTGDFVDDYRIDPILRNDRSFLFLITVDKSGIKKLKLMPTLIDNMQVNVATGKEKEETLARMKMLSAEFGTKISDDGMVEKPAFAKAMADK